MNHNLGIKEKIIVAIFVVFLIGPIFASLAYAEFVEQLWPVQTETVDTWYQPHINGESSLIHRNPYVNTANDPFNYVIQNPYPVLILGAIFAGSVYMVFRGSRVSRMNVYHD